MLMFEKDIVEMVMLGINYFRGVAIEAYNRSSSKGEFIDFLNSKVEKFEKDMKEDAKRRDRARQIFKPTDPRCFTVSNTGIVHRNTCRFAPKRIFKDPDVDGGEPLFNFMKEVVASPANKEYATYEELTYTLPDSRPCKICKPDQG